jgi:PiT family inorganic phosphate transporter
MTPTVAILLVTTFTFIAPFSAGLAVADTIGTFVNLHQVDALVGESLVVAALVSAVTYNLATWLLGYPSSSSNSLAGGLVGAGFYAVGNSHINWGVASLAQGELVGVMKVLAGLLFSPLLGFAIGFLVMRLIFVVFRRFNRRIRRLFVISQYVSVAWLGFSHGANDAQKGMAIIGMVLLASGVHDHFDIPVWAIVLCATSISLGTLFGGWRIIKTLGFGLFRVRVLHSVANQLGSALVNTIATSIGAPTSTTQVVTATLLGNGAAEKPGHVKWRTAIGIATGWLFNLPVSMLLGWAYCALFLRLME